MEEKRPIDRKRESGGSTDIGTKEDGAIKEMYTLNNRLIVIKEKAIYELVLADEIDPERTNIHLPSNIQRLLVNQGTDSPIVSSTFLTAKTLFRPELFESIDTTQAITLSLQLQQELIILEKEIQDYLDEEKKVSAAYEERRNLPVSYAIPSIPDVETRCKTIFQKADHVEQIITDIIRIFFSKGVGKKLSDFHEMLKAAYGEEDPFCTFIENLIPFWELIRIVRNCLDHRLVHVKVKDFELQKDGTIFTPTISLDHKDGKLERESLSSLLPLVLQNFLTIFESLAAYLCVKTARLNLLFTEVREIPEDKRRYKLVKYGYWGPLGEGGYYSQ